jgi:chlorite dismutase
MLLGFKNLTFTQNNVKGTSNSGGPSSIFMTIFKVKFPLSKVGSGYFTNETNRSKMVQYHVAFGRNHPEFRSVYRY